MFRKATLRCEEKHNYEILIYAITIAKKVGNLESSTTARALAAGRVCGDRGDVLDAANLEARTGEGTKSGLGTRARGLRSVTTGGSHLDVNSSDTQLLGLGSGVHGGKHCSVRGRFVSVSLDLHATSDTAQSFTTGKVGDVLERSDENGRKKETKLKSRR